MIPRPYQIGAIEALDDYLASHDGNPCIELPTGSGKTPTMAWAIQRYVETWPGTRVIVIAHIRELLEQGVEKMKTIWPQAPIGVYSAGLRRKDLGYSITYASIQSVYKRACDFDPFDLIFVDEAHRIPLEQEGQYQKFIADAKLNNPLVRVVGWTATAYRLGGGQICHPKYILNEVIYKANVKHLIDDGYLSPLRTKVGLHEVDTKGVKKSGGDFNKGELAARASVDATVDGIAAEAVEILNKENRQAVLFFCVTIEHAEKMGKALSLLGIDAPAIHSKTPNAERSDLVRRFGAGQLRALCNVNVLAEGFDAQRIDAVVMIRPTESKGLYYQQVGRGLRIHPEKTDCLVLDFAGNIGRHGPIDVLDGDKPEMITCGSDLYCREHFPMPLGKCPACGWIIPPPPPKEDVQPKVMAPRIIPSDPKSRSEAAILSDAKPWEMIPLDVQVNKHSKQDKPPSLCVTYMAGMESHREWICFEHTGYARRKAETWWKSRFGEPIPATVDEALASDMFIDRTILEKTAAITVRQVGKYTEIVGARLKTNAEAVAR